MASEIAQLQPAEWEFYRAMREHWTHEDNLVNHRLMWLILSQGLLFTAFGTLSAAKVGWLVFGFPFFGMVAAAVIWISIAAAFSAIDEVRRRYELSGLAARMPISPGGPGGAGRWTAKSLPFVFGALWVLALVGTIGA